MSVTAPQPTFSRVVSILWFPFFLAVAMSALFVAPLAHPTPNAMPIGLVGSQTQVEQLQAELDEVVAGGFDVDALSRAEAEDAVMNGRIAAAVLAGADPAILVASDTGATRVEYLDNVLPPVVGAALRDIGPSAVGDATGTGVFFFGLPISIVAMVTAIVLLQLAAWSLRRKLLAVVVVGAFTAVVTYAIAVWQQVVPLTWSSALLIVGTFVFVQGVGWTLTGAATFVRQFFVPVALTFVLVLGVPTAGAPVSPDMRPTALGLLHEVMPLGQFITLVRSLAYGVGSPLHPWLVLLAWLLVGAVLSALANKRVQRGHATASQPAEHSGRLHTLHGSVLSLSGAPVAYAAVWVLNEDGTSVLRTVSDASGSYSIPEVPEGLHHVLVTGAHAEPEIVTVT